MGVARTSGAVLLVLAVVFSGAAAQKSTAKDRREQRITVLPQFANHPALQHIDLRFCGTGSESQISKGPLGCGFPIVGDHPWLVALGYRTIDGSVDYICSGALITDRMVVTSALCAQGTETLKLTTVRAGEYNLTSSEDCLWYEPSECIKFQERKVASVLPHPKFATVSIPGSGSIFDIAVIELEDSVTVQYGVSPICLPMFPLRRPPKAQFATSFNLHTPAPAVAAVESGLVGGGFCCDCDRDRNATSHVMDQEKLTDYNAIYNGTEPCQYRLLQEPAQGRQEGKDKCLGAGEPCVADLGAPLVSPDIFGSAYYLLGVASLVPSRDECLSTPGASVLYSPIEPNIGWILDSVACLQNNNCRSK